MLLAAALGDSPLGGPKSEGAVGRTKVVGSHFSGGADMKEGQSGCSGENDREGRLDIWPSDPGCLDLLPTAQVNACCKVRLVGFGWDEQHSCQPRAVPEHLGASPGTTGPRVCPGLKASGHPGPAVFPVAFALAHTGDSGYRAGISSPCGCRAVSEGTRIPVGPCSTGPQAWFIRRPQPQLMPGPVWVPQQGKVRTTVQTDAWRPKHRDGL